MNRMFFAASVAAALSLPAAAPAAANETEDFCVDFASGNGWDTTPCPCVGEVAEANPAVKDAVLALSSPEDVDAMDEAVKEDLAVCFPEEG